MLLYKIRPLSFATLIEMLLHLKDTMKSIGICFNCIQLHDIPCHATGHINVMLVLQSCTDPLEILPCSSSGTFPASSDGACNFSNVKVEEDVDVNGDGVVAINEELDTGINQEDISEEEDIMDIQSETDGVSYICVCVCLSVIRQVLPLSRSIPCNISNIKV
jgi:hypothetical protein